MRDNMNDDTAERMLAIMAKYTAATDIGPASRLRNDLGVDSFDIANIAIEAQERFGFAFPEKNIPPFATAGEMIEFVRKLRREQA